MMRSHADRSRLLVLTVALALGVAVFALPSWRSGLRSQEPAARHVASAASLPQEPWSRLPLAFVRNDGQWNTDLSYIARLPGGRVGVSPRVLSLDRTGGAPGRGCLVDLVFEGARSDVKLSADSEPTSKRNFFLGDEPSRWRTDVPAYSSVRMEGLYDGTDVLLLERNGRFEYDVLLDPGARLEDVVIRCDGADGLWIDADGRLILETALGPIVQHAPDVWQVTPDGSKLDVPCRYELLDERRFTFVVPGGWNSEWPLVIDPGVTWGTYLGGSNNDNPEVVQRLASGDVLVAGSTLSSNFPVTPGAYDTTSSFSAFLSVFDETASSLRFSTLLGGDEFDGIVAVSVDAAGNFTVTGTTESDNFPTSPGAFQPANGGGLFDIFVATLDATGSTLLYSTYLGGACQEIARLVDVEASGHILLAGSTCSPTFPSTPGTYDPTFSGTADMFCLWLDPSQTGSAQLVRGTFLGGSLAESVADAVRTETGAILLCGETLSTDFPVTPGVIDPVFTAVNTNEWFISRLSSDGTTLEASTYFAPRIRALSSAGQGAVIVGGSWFFIGYPLPPTSFQPEQGQFNDAYVLCLDAAFGSIDWYGWLGGSSQGDALTSLASSPGGPVLVGGQTSSPDFPVTDGAQDTEYSNGCGDAFFSAISADGSELVYSTFLGEATFVCNCTKAVAADGPDGALVIGEIGPAGFPVTEGAFDTTWNGGSFGDAFVVRLPLSAIWSNLGVGIVGSLGTPKLVGISGLCAGEDIELRLTRALPGASATLVLGFTAIEVPFKGGVLVPSPDVVISGLPVNASGALTLIDTWPSGVPSGAQIVLQAWIPDPVGPKGLAASNGLVGTTP